MKSYSPDKNRLRNIRRPSPLRMTLLSMILFTLLVISPITTSFATGSGDEPAPPSGLAIASIEMAPVHLDPNDPHKVLYQDEQVLLMGIYPQIGAITHGDTEAEYDYVTMLNTLAAHDVLFFRSMLAMGPDRRSSWPLGQHTLSPWLRTGPGTTNDNGPRYDLEQFNEQLFTHWDSILQAAYERDIIVQLTLIDCWSIKQGDHYGWGWDYHPFNGTNNINGIDATDSQGVGNDGFTDLSRNDVIEIQKALIRKVVDSYSQKYPNLIYEIANENYYSQAWEMELANYLVDYEISRGYPRHLVMPRDLPNHDFAIGANWYAGDIKMYDPFQLNDGMQTLWNMSQPLISDSDGLEHGISAQRFGQWFWGAFSSGGFASYLTPDLTEHPDGSSLVQEFDRAQVLAQLFSTYQSTYATMVPCDHVIASGNGFAIGSPGNRTIAYFPDGGKAQLQLPDLQEHAHYTIQVHDAITGERLWSEKKVVTPQVNIDLEANREYYFVISTDVLVPSFDDVPPHHWAYHEIETLYQNGYTSGCSLEPLLYCPDDVTQRDHISVFNLRADYGVEFEPPAGLPRQFDDVDPENWAHAWVTQFFIDGYTSGCRLDPPLFCPERALTLEEMAVYALRMSNSRDFEPPPAEGLFHDTEIDHWGTPWIEEAYRQELIDACATEPDLLICPGQEVTRAMAAVVIVRAKNLTAPVE